MNWRVLLNGADITAYCSGVQTRYEADAICGEVEVQLASRAPLVGIVVPRVPQALAITVDEYVDGAWISRGAYYLEEIGYPQEIDAETATIWGRSESARLTTPWAQKVSKQWSAATSVADIIAEMAALCGVTVNVTNDFDVCQYCYVVSDQYPSEVIRDLATRSGQIPWPQVDGSLLIAPRAYTYGTPDVELDAAEVVMDSVTRTAPDFGNRILISGDGEVAGLSVTVTPLADDDACVAANGTDTVRLIAVVLDADGAPVASGTTVTWTASAGSLASATSVTATATIQGEAHTADSYHQITLDFPAAAIAGVYAHTDVRRSRNLYVSRRGSVSGRTITFADALDYYDQALIVDYDALGATNTWTAGVIPGDVTVLASVAGAQGSLVMHQGNPNACSSGVTLEATPSDPCRGDAVTVLARVERYNAAGTGPVKFGLSGCGRLSAHTKTLGARTLTETLRAVTWGGTSQVTLSAYPSGNPSIVLPSAPTNELYLSHTGKVVTLDTLLTAGTQVTATYTGAGTAVVTWTPDALPTGLEHIDEWVYSTQAEVEGATVAQVTLTRTPASTSTPICVPLSSNDDYFASRSAKVVTLIDDPGTTDPIPVGTYVRCTYDTPWSLQADCEATITARVEDGSQDGATASLSVSASDCRTVTGGDDYDPDDDDTSEETGEGDDDSGGDDTEEDVDTEDEEDDTDPDLTYCDAAKIQARISSISEDTWSSTAGVGAVTDCPGKCTADEICAALRANGTLGKAGLFYAQCVARVAAARTAQCTTCTLSGPETLNPGEIGIFNDGRGNTGVVSGDLTYVDTVSSGYRLRMPAGGAGPFTAKVCYGTDAAQCCEAEVAFPPCTVTGPSSMDPGAEASFTASAAGVTGTVGGEMTLVRQMAYDVGVVAKMNDDACTGGTVTINRGGQVCGTIDVASTYASFVGFVGGDATMEPGEMSYYYHNLGAGATYTGTLVMGSSDDGGAVLVMPSDAATGATYTASWTASCGRSASLDVGVGWADGQCPYPTCGSGPAPVGSLVSISAVPGMTPGAHCFRVLPTYSTSLSWWDNAPCGHTTRPAWTVINVYPTFMGVQALETDYPGAKLYQVELAE